MSLDASVPKDTTTRLEILIVENDPATARLTVEAFREVGISEGVVCVRDGEQTMKFLRQEGEYVSAPRPDLIFLDLHLPKKSGLQVLSEIKANKRLMVTPIVVVSGSEDPQEVRRAYELHASCYIRKPNDLHQFLRFVAICYEFWGTVVTLPTTEELASSAP